jgi:hypothetical protein
MKRWSKDGKSKHNTAGRRAKPMCEKNSWSGQVRSSSGAPVDLSAFPPALLLDLREALRVPEPEVRGIAYGDLQDVPGEVESGVHRHPLCPRCEADFIRRRLAADRFLEAVKGRVVK